MKKPLLDCAHCTSRRLGVFCGLAGGCVDELNKGKTTNVYSAKQVVFYEGNAPFGIYCIFSGKVKLYKTGKGGQQQIVRIAQPGDILGYRSVLADEPYHATAEALEDANICFIEKSAFQSVLGKDPAATAKVMKKISKELGEAENRIISIVQKSVKQRLAEVLCLLMRKFEGKKKGDISLSLSREELAELADTTQETAMRLLSEFKDKKYINVDGRHISILDPPALFKLADLEY